jgi:hypothetical protein
MEQKQSVALLTDWYRYEGAFQRDACVPRRNTSRSDHNPHPRLFLSNSVLLRALNFARSKAILIAKPPPFPS